MAIIKNTISFVIIVCGVILCVYTVGLFSTSKSQTCSQKDNVSVDTDSNLKTELPRYIYKEHPRYFSGGYNYLSRSEMAAFSNSATFTMLLAGHKEQHIEVILEDGATISSACFDYQLIDRHGGKLKNIVFNNCNFLRSRIANVVFDNCTFRSSSFSRCKLDFDSIDSSFDNVQFHNCYIDIPYTLLKQTKNLLLNIMLMIILKFLNWINLMQIIFLKNILKSTKINLFFYVVMKSLNLFVIDIYYHLI